MSNALELSPDGTWILYVNDESVSELEVPEGVTSIDVVLNDMTYLRKIILPSTLKSIEYGAFQECSLLDTIILKSTNIKIESNAFSGTSIDDVYLLVDHINDIDIDEDAFEFTVYIDAILHVPAKIYNDCFNHPVWGRFDYIFTLEEEEEEEEEEEKEEEETEDWATFDFSEFEEFVDFFNDDFDDDTIFKVVYTNKQYETHGFRITHVRESAIYGSQFIDAYCIDQDGEYEGIERTFRIYRFSSIKKEKKKYTDE